MIEKHVLIRSYNAGVFCGVLTKRDNNVVTLKNARRIWYWEGAASLSELAMKGTSKPENCKFPCEVTEITIFNTIEIILMTQDAVNNIKNVPEWTSMDE